MSNILKSTKLFAGATILFALASLYNMSGSASNSLPSRLTLLPNSSETIESGPAVAPQPAEHARS
jgi:hypothetical protein